ncbi:MAG: DUF4129 domain-containing protein [Clostridiaceae bacterium]|nr:DUF4129 domain-containing protein [Clostridiaceae bacterium]
MPTKRLLRLPFHLSLTDCLTEIMQDLLIMTTLAIPIERLAPSWRIDLYVVLSVTLLLSFFARLACRKMWQFVLLNLAVLVLPVALPVLPALDSDIWPRLILIISLVFLAIRTFYLRLRQSREQSIGDLVHQSFVVVYLIGLSLVAERLELSYVGQGIFYIGIIYLTLALIRWHWVSLSSQMERFSGLSTQPWRRILRFNRILLLCFCLVVVLLLVLSPWLRLHELIPWLGQMLLVGLRWLIQHLVRGGQSENTPETQQTTSPSEDNPQLPLDRTETAQWVIILQQIFYYLAVTVCILAVLALIVYLIYRLYRRFYESKQPDSDKTESLLPGFAMQTKERLSRTKNRFTQQFGQAPDQKIRRLFYRLIETQIKLGLQYSPSMTTRHIENLLKTDQYPEFLAMTQLYEQARYGPGSCTAADAARMLAYYRNLRRQNLVKSI